MDEPILQLLNHLTLKHFIWGVASASIATVLLTLMYGVILRGVTRWARR